MATEKADYRQVKFFRDAYKDLESLYDRFPKMCGLAAAEYWALSMIYEGIATQHDICEQLSLSRQTVNSAFKQLRNRGFIRLEPMDGNLRVKQIYLTEAGTEFIEKEIRKMHRLEEEVWKTMLPEEQKHLTELLRKYGSRLSDALQQQYKEN